MLNPVLCYWTMLAASSASLRGGLDRCFQRCFGADLWQPALCVLCKDAQLPLQAQLVLHSLCLLSSPCRQSGHSGIGLTKGLQAAAGHLQ